MAAGLPYGLCLGIWLIGFLYLVFTQVEGKHSSIVSRIPTWESFTERERKGWQPPDYGYVETPRKMSRGETGIFWRDGPVESECPDAYQEPTGFRPHALEVECEEMAPKSTPEIEKRRSE
jgi:hypothetical protein